MSDVAGRVEAIWIKRAHRGPMDSVPEATLVANRGFADSVDRSREVVDGLQAVMRSDWRGGVFAQVVAGGVVRIGDRIAWDSVPALRAARG